MAALNKHLSGSGEAQASPDEDRSSARYRLHFPVTTAQDEATTIAATVRDLSNSGMLLDTTAALALGSRLLVELPAVGTVLAEVVRQQDGLYGCEFHSRVPDVAVREAIRSSPIAWLRPEGGKSTDRAEPPVPGLEDSEASPIAADMPQRWPIAGRIGFVILASGLLWGLILAGLWIAIA